MMLDPLCIPNHHTDDVKELVLRVDRIEYGELTVEQTLKTDF
jgi:hypothetical protein